MLDLHGKGPPLEVRILSRAVRTAARPEDLLDELSRQPMPALLDSSAADVSFGAHSILACRPIEVLSLRDGRLCTRLGEMAGDPLVALRGALRRLTVVGPSEKAGGYGPGWIGYIGYEFGRLLERLPGRAVRDTRMGDLHLALYDAAAVFDHAAGRWTLHWLTAGGVALSDAHERLAAMLQDAQAGTAQQRPEPAKSSPRGPLNVRSNFTQPRYEQAVQRCLEYLAAGDIFQVNLSQRLTVADPPSPLAIYKALRRRNPAWYSSMLLGEGWSVLSSSPELFLRIRNGQVLTRPIKGTRPRTGQASEDAAAAQDLLNSPKDNAELAMIIDLLRNDLGRICRFGSMQVLQRRQLEEHPTVFHLVGSIVGRLREGVDMVDVLAATFPGGSITGAPKIRAMEIIDELEDIARGVYTGSIGWIGPSGDCELNIAIRTIVCEGGRATIGVGGGIVADSQPASEYQETLDKARALLEAIDMARSD